MIRKVIISVLTLAAFGTAIGSVIGDRRRPYSWDMGGERRISLLLGRSRLEVVYRTIGGSSKPDIRLLWMNWGIIRTGMCDDDTCSPPVYVAVCPSWFPVVVFAAYPLCAVTRIPARHRRRRREQGLCVDCGYDLTGNVTGRCSECGTRIDEP